MPLMIILAAIMLLELPMLIKDKKFIRLLYVGIEEEENSEEELQEIEESTQHSQKEEQKVEKARPDDIAKLIQDKINKRRGQ